MEALEPRQLLSAGITATYGSTGLSTLSYNNGTSSSTVINVPAHGGDGFQVEGYYTESSSGTLTWVYTGSAIPSWSPTVVNGATVGGTATYSYSWGSIACTYSQPAGTTNRLNFSYTIDNTSTTTTIGGVALQSANLRFPAALPYPAGDVLLDFGFDGPNVQVADYGSGVMVMVDDTVNLAPATNSQLYAGLWSNTDGSGTYWSMVVNSAPFNGTAQNSAWPLFNTPVAPGGTDKFEVSLRFAPEGTDPYPLATDVEQAWAAAFPLQLNWPDRRPVAQLMLTSAADVSSTNAEGWALNGASINVTTPSGLYLFAQALLAYADGSVGYMQAEDAQGMITWDVEGQMWQQPTSFIGDASLATSTTADIQNVVNVNGTLETPMGYVYTGPGALYGPGGVAEPLIDQYFQVFSNAGFRIGVCLRPTIIENVDGTPEQITPTNESEATILATKMEYAYQQWGCTLFYLDSNSGYDAAQLQTALQDFYSVYPNANVLIMPEHQTTSVYAYSAPYGQLAVYDYTGTPEPAQLTYPNGFSFIYPANGDNGNPGFPDYFWAIEKSVARGDSILFRGWFADPYNTTIHKVYEDADATPATPLGVSASATVGAANVSWLPVTGAGMFESGVYNLMRSTTVNGAYTTVGWGVQGTSYSDASVINGQQYYYEVVAVDGVGSGSASTPVSLTADWPVLASGPTASINPVTGKSTSLSVSATDPAGSSSLIYTWTYIPALSTPSNAPPPTFSANGTDAAQNATATFYQAGSYFLAVKITNSAGVSITPPNLEVVVSQTVTKMYVEPANATINGPTQYSVLAWDQFSNPIT
jgi:hypothetical protein